MLTWKFFILIGIITNFISSLKRLQRDKTKKAKFYMVMSTLLLLFGIFMIVDAFQ